MVYEVDDAETRGTYPHGSYGDISDFTNIMIYLAIGVSYPKSGVHSIWIPTYQNTVT